jgi:hypothetical protein
MPVFVIDPGQLAQEARFVGIFVVRTITKITPLQAVPRYRDLLQVENLFLRTKAVMWTRLIIHSRSRDPGARILFVPGPCHAEMPGKLVTRGRRRAGMDDASA